MHEVGHTLGLAHNFKASTLYSLAELNDPAKTAFTGIGASVMDYNPVNLVPEGMTQGDYFSTTTGPYDTWAIEYGYKQLKGGSPDAEQPELVKIAARSVGKEVSSISGSTIASMSVTSRRSPASSSIRTRDCRLMAPPVRHRSASPPGPADTAAYRQRDARRWL